METKKIILAIGSFIVLLSISIGCTYLFDYIKGVNAWRESICVVMGFLSCIGSVIIPLIILEKAQ